MESRAKCLRHFAGKTLKTAAMADFLTCPSSHPFYHRKIPFATQMVHRSAACARQSLTASRIASLVNVADETASTSQVCPSACAFHNRLIRNLLTLVSRKNFQLNRKLEHMSKRTTREKLLSYLSMESKKANASTFTIPFNRQQLADYLSVDRSAMSNELCKLRDAGILEFNKNTFTIFEKND